jgi:hypothetical protein
MERIIGIEVDEHEKEDIRKASEITTTEYIDANFYEVNYLVTLLQDLVMAYDKLQEDYNDLEERYTDKYYGNE